MKFQQRYDFNLFYLKEKNAITNFMCAMAAILFRPQWVNVLMGLGLGRLHWVHRPPCKYRELPDLLHSGNPGLHHNHMLPDNITVTVTFHECHGISNHWQLNYLFNSSFQLTSKKTSQLHITGPMSGKTTGDQWISLTRWLKSLAIPMFVQHLVKLVSKETSKLCITGLVWGESTSHRWFPLTKVQ